MSPPRRQRGRARAAATIALLAAVAATPAPAQDPDRTEENAMFESGTVHVDGRDYPYRLLPPPESAPAPDAGHPLVVFLHGAGERGDDNDRQLHWLPRTMAQRGNRARHPCYLLAVQCPTDQRWVEVPWGARSSTPQPAAPSQPMRAVIAALQRTLAERPIDRTRVYLTGLSMGGYGAFDLGCRHPEWFAAVLPVCGGGDQRQAHRLVGLPIWVWHGDADRAVPVERSRQMVAAIRAADGEVRYTELPGVGHASWKQAYGAEGALGWLFEQRRTPAPMAALVPWPDVVEPRAGELRLGAGLRIGAMGPSIGREEALAAAITARTQLEVPVVRVAPGVASLHEPEAAAPLPWSGADVTMAIDESLPPSGLRVVVGSQGVTLQGGDVAGLGGAGAVLLQLLEADGDGFRLPFCRVEDRPEMPFRCVLIDCARHFQSLATLRGVIDLCHVYRVPFVQLHLSDHEGFRFPSLAFPEVVSAQHYTRDELRELITYAAARGVTLVPELDVPGHSRALVEGRPDVFALAGDGNRGVVNMGRAAAREGLVTLIGELCEVFRGSPWVHIGGDEVDLTGVAEDPDCQACMQGNGLAGPHELMRWFVVQMHEAVKARGRRTLVWEGFAPGGTPAMPDDLVVVAWESAYYPPDQLVADGFTVVNASWQPLYVVGGGKLPPHTAPRRWSPAHIYRWHPRRWEHFAPRFPSFGGVEVGADAPVIGAMMCVWEQLDGTAVAHLRDRLPAFAERAANPTADRGYADFAARARGADALVAALLARHRLAVRDAAAADEWAALQHEGPPRARYRLFAAPERGFAAVPDLDDLTPYEAGTLPILRGGPLAGPMAVELSATLQVPAAGDYAFRLESCDGPARLWLGGEVAVDHAVRDDWAGTEATVTLQQGDVPLRVVAAQGWFSTLCRVQWRPPGAERFTLVDDALRVLEQRK